MATTTPNYGWTVPTSTDLVKDGATAIETLGDAIDASMNTALGTKKAGMVLLNTTSFSAVASQSINSVFSSTYENYRIVYTTSGFSASDALTLRLRASGTDLSSANYSYCGTKNASNTATISALNASGQTSMALGSTNSGAGDRCGITIDIFKPINKEQLSPLVSYQQAKKTCDFKPDSKEKHGLLSDLIFGKQSGGNITKELKNISKTYFNKKT